MSDIDLKLCDFIKLSKMWAAEYRKPELSDRVLVFDVMQDGWETANIRYGISAIEIVDQSEKQNLETPEEKTQNELEHGKFDEIKDEGATVSLQNEDDKESEDYHSSEISLRTGPETQATLPCTQALYVVMQPSGKLDDKVSADSSIMSRLSRESNENAAATTQTLISSQTNEPLRQHKIYVHTFWLSIQSPYFRSLFYSSGMKENRDREVHVKVSQSEENAHLILLEALYRDDVLNDETVDQLLAVLELANKYDLKLVFNKCKYVLQKKATTLQICTQIVHVVKEKQNFDDVEDLIETVKPVITKAFSPLDNHWESEKFTNLSEQCLRYVLNSNDLTVSTENVVFQALMYWIEKNELDPEEASDLLKLVRFKLVTIDYIHNVMKNHPIASKMVGFKDLLLDGAMYLATPAQQKRLFNKPYKSRRRPEETIIHYTGVIKKYEFETALENKSEIHSKKFWACGYKLSAGFNPSSKNSFLIVHNLKKRSYIPLRFAAFNANKSPTLQRVISWECWNDKRFTIDSCRENFKNYRLSRSAFEQDTDTLTYCVAVESSERSFL